MNNPLFKQTLRAVIGLAVIPFLGACGSSSSDSTRNTGMHRELKIVDPVTGLSANSASISVGSIYLESQLSPVSVNSLQLQASDVSLQGANAYVGYSSYDATGNSKVGAVEQVKPYNCDNIATLYTEYCLSVIKTFDFPATDIFSTYSDGTNLYATGSTSAEDQPTPARLYKLTLDASKSPTAIASTVVLPSYAGTGVMTIGTKVYASYGTSSTDNTKLGGLRIMNSSDLSTVVDQPLYDARAVASYRNDTSKVYVARGKVDNSNLGAVLEYNSSGSGVALRTINNGGNAIAESKSSVIVGNELILASMGDQGFRVICKATGASLASQAAVTVAGIAASRTVTNSVIAAPGYIFAANGEAGVYIYSFKKSSALNGSYCQGVTLNLLGRLALDADNSDATYVNAELSANSLTYVPVFSVANLLISKLIIIASGNKGISLLNISAINVSLTDIDDF